MAGAKIWPRSSPVARYRLERARSSCRDALEQLAIIGFGRPQIPTDPRAELAEVGALFSADPFLVDHLQRDTTSELRVACEINLAHPAAREEADDFEASDPIARAEQVAHQLRLGETARFAYLATRSSEPP
jgi:hypothetical protein